MHNIELKPLPYDYDELDPSISEQVVTWHHDKHQQGYVNGLQSYKKKIEKMRETGDFSNIRSVKQGLTHNGSGMALHELYWENMGGNGGRPDGAIAKQIKEDFGSFDTFKQEFAATAQASRGWAILVWWPRTESLEIVMVDFHDQFALWGAIPVLACDTWEHAYYYDRGPDGGTYVDEFFSVLHWDRINERFEDIR
jgi:Fe-Mn family superoxide dismutase